MLGFVLRAEVRRDGLKCLADARRAVGCDLIAHGETGALLSTRDLHRLPEAIAEMLDLSDTERAAMGTRARAHVLTRHQPRTECETYAELYRSMLEPRATLERQISVR